MRWRSPAGDGSSRQPGNAGGLRRKADQGRKEFRLELTTFSIYSPLRLSLLFGPGGRKVPSPAIEFS